MDEKSAFRALKNKDEAAPGWFIDRYAAYVNTIVYNVIGNSDTGLGITYDIYGAYTQEMADKLDEIAEKYGLSLHGEPINTPMVDTVEEFMDLVAYGNFLGNTNCQRQ